MDRRLSAVAAARKIAELASDAHALSRADFPQECALAEDLARAACRAIALARKHEARAPLRVVVNACPRLAQRPA